MSTLSERLKGVRLVRKLVYFIVGIISYPGLMVVNRLKISGTEHLRRLPKKNVLFVSNHQTYFAEVITFLQGTTKAFAPGRKGTALIIKQNKPIVVPVVISGFWRAFNKTGLKFKKKGVLLSVTFKAPLDINYDAPAEEILALIMDAI